MGTLSTLKLTAAQRPGKLSAVQQRRSKLIGRIDEQIALAKSTISGKPYAGVRLRMVADESGVKRQVESAKRVKAWWFNAESGKLALCVRYGARVLELSKGKWAVEVGSTTELVGTLEIVRSAVEGGELDAAIEAAASKLKSGFKR